MKSDYNIEFAHIYSSEVFSPEHAASVSALQKLLQKLPSGPKVSTAVLIDEYNPKQNILDISDFLATVSKAGVKPDFVAYESALTKRGYEVLNLIADDRLATSYNNYLRTHHKFPCSFLVAVWNLIRLGCIEVPDGLFCVTNKDCDSFMAHEAISILPAYFKPVEDRAQTIVSATPFANRVGSIKQLYFDMPETPFKLQSKQDIF